MKTQDEDISSLCPLGDVEPLCVPCSEVHPALNQLQQPAQQATQPQGCPVVV